MAIHAMIPLAAQQPDYSLDIAPFTIEASARHHYKTIAYNGRVPGPLLRVREGQAVTIDVHNHSSHEEVVHWHGLFLPSQIDGAMEEGTPHYSARRQGPLHIHATTCRTALVPHAHAGR